MQDTRAYLIAITFIGVIGIGALATGVFAPVQVASEMPTIVAGAVGALGGFLGAQGLSQRHSGQSGGVTTTPTRPIRRGDQGG